MDSADSDRLLAALRVHADCVLHEARGRGPQPELFVDALDVDSRQPPTWLHPADGRPMVLSNLANQQDLLRLLTGLSAVTGEPEYHLAAAAAVRAGFSGGRDASGLLRWGGHWAMDLTSGTAFGMDDFHELKTHYPYYDLMWEVNPRHTEAFITAFWHRHVLDWNNLDLNRHGHFGPPAVSADWPELRSLGPVFFVGEGLSFINTGSDLFYSAALLAGYTGFDRPRQWAERLARRYAEETRHPDTGLGGYQFSRIEGDRAEAQLGPEFGERAREYSVLDRTRASRKFAVVGLCQLELAERLGPAGEPYLRWAVSDLTAFARHAYDAATNRFHALLRDGTRLSPADVKRPGYYRPETFQPYAGTPLLFWAYARGFRLSGDPFLAATTAALARGLGLGEVLTGQPHVPASANDAWTLQGLLELHRARQSSSLLAAAVAVANNLLRDRFVGRLFVEYPNQRYARIGRPEPLALLHLVAALRGERPDTVPAQLPGEKYFTAHALGKGRTSDYLDWFPQTRSPHSPPP
jgi:pectate lyase